MNRVEQVEIKKKGTGKNGPWTMFGVTLDDGRKASGFDHINCGDWVEVTENGKYLNYTKCDPPPERHTPPQELPVTRSGGAPGAEYWDNRNHRIERQHSQEMALRFFALNTSYQGWKPPTTKQLCDMISWFQRDIGREPAMPDRETAQPEQDDEPPF